MTEAQEQAAVIEYCDAKGITIYHIPNERKCSERYGGFLKRQGLRPGMPDLCIPEARGDYHALYIEMKSLTGKPTPKQQEWITRLRKLGNCAYVCNGADNAIALIERYFGLPRP